MTRADALIAVTVFLMVGVVATLAVGALLVILAIFIRPADFDWKFILECLKFGIDCASAAATLVLAFLTGFLFWATWKVASETRDVSKATVKLSVDAEAASLRQLGVQTWLEMQKRFDSNEMVRARHKLGQALLEHPIFRIEDISDTVLNFFEDIGALYNKGFIDKELTHSSFSYYACHWWEAVKGYIDNERKEHGDDRTLFANFESLAEALRMRDKIDQEALLKFIDEEAVLRPD